MSEQELEKSPYLETQIAEYDAMLREMRAAIAAEFPGGEWLEDGQPSTNIAADGLTEGYRGRSSIWLFSISISESEADKRRALDAIAPIVVGVGFAEPIRYVDEEGRVQATGDDNYGAVFDLVSSKRTTLRYTTGVHPKRKLS